MKEKRVQFGTLLSGDFSKKTLTFEMKSDFFIQAGKYALIHKDVWDNMNEMLDKMK